MKTGFVLDLVQCTAELNWQLKALVYCVTSSHLEAATCTITHQNDRIGRVQTGAMEGVDILMIHLTHLVNMTK